MDFSTDTWIALASSATALCALGLSLWEGHQNRRHNKLSVRPLLTAEQNFENIDNEKIIRFELMNAGFGPAIIKDFILSYDGREVSKNNRKTYESFLEEKTKGFKILNIFSFVPDSSMPQHEKCELFSFSCKLDSNPSFMNKLNLRINYQSIYQDEIFTYDSRKDRLFQGLGENVA